MAHNQPGSSANPGLHEADVPLKIRRVTKACDLCRKRKARCDGDPASPKACTLCENSGVACVFTRFARKRGHESSQARELETRIIEIEGLIRLMAPGIDIEQEIDESAQSSDSADNPHTFLRPADSAFLQPSAAFLPPSADSTSAFLHPGDGLYQISPLEEETKPDINAPPFTPQSPSKASSMNTPYSRPGPSAGSTYTAPTPVGGMMTPPGTSSGTPYSILSPPNATPGPGLSGSRPHYYSELSYTEGSEITIGLELAHAWKREIQPQNARRNSRQTNPAEYHGSYTKPLRDKLPTRVAPQDLWFPPEDLLYSLVDLYFKRYNVLLPLLHRPTFEAQLAEKLHWRDPSFAAVVLLVCANGSRFSDDTRVMPFYDEDVPPDVREFDAGILFYRQVDVCSVGVFPVDVLFEHQIVVLGAMYVTIGNPSAVLVATGVSLRLGMQRGIHRNAWQGEVNTHQKALNDEMWRRVFWSSYVLDVLFSTFYGRPTSVLSDQYDLAPPMPMEGEDPLAVNGFRQFTKLCEILTEITRTMYATGRKYDPKRQKLTSMPENEGRLRTWYQNLPQQLKWTPESGYHCSAPLLEVATWLNSYTCPIHPIDVEFQVCVPTRADPLRFSALRSSYHFSQILVRRPYAMIPAAGEAGKTLFEESRALCLRSARTNAAMLGHYLRINPKPMPWLMPSTRETLVVLVMNGLHLHRESPSSSDEEGKQDPLLRDCVDILQLMGRVGVHVADMANMLRELATPINSTQSP